MYMDERGEGVTMNETPEPVEEKNLTDEIEAAVKRAEDRGDALPLLSGLVNAFLGTGE